jgi:putative SOS response-associated peptidase YedK
VRTLLDLRIDGPLPRGTGAPAADHLVLSAEHAREWVAPETTPERAAETAKVCCRPTEGFPWFEVSKDVGNVRNQ